MPQQKLTFPDNGAKAMRVLETLTPLNGVVAPAVNASFLGQFYIDTVAPAVYVSIATDSVAPADDWVEINSFIPATGVAAPAAHALFIGQTFIDTVAAKAYIAVAIDSVAAADDWKEITLVAGA